MIGDFDFKTLWREVKEIRRIYGKRLDMHRKEIDELSQMFKDRDEQKINDALEVCGCSDRLIACPHCDMKFVMKE
jgi:hypothetical protein